MNKRFNKTQRNYMIMGLCAILLEEDLYYWAISPYVGDSRDVFCVTNGDLYNGHVYDPCAVRPAITLSSDISLSGSGSSSDPYVIM